MIDVTKVKSQLLYLIKKANDKTEKSDADLTAAVETLVNGYYDLVIADDVKFSSEHSDTKKLYATGYNWFADLVGVTQRMCGQNNDMALDEVLYWLGRVKFIPQGWANSILEVGKEELITNAKCILPIVQKGTANSTLNFNFLTFNTSVK